MTSSTLAGPPTLRCLGTAICTSVLLCFAALVVCSPALFAQSIVGSLSGSITDGSGAAVPGATVSVINAATSETRMIISDSSGSFTAPALTPSLYRVVIKANGFETETANDVTVSQGVGAHLTIVLKVGNATETVNVNAGTQTLQTDSAEVRGEIDNKQLANLPIPASRNYESALILIPGITPPANSNSLAANPSRGLIFQTNGAFGSANNIRIDGATAINVWLPHVAGYNPGLEAIDSVSVVTNSYDAQQGLAGGASVNVHIKTGSNAFHGSAFEFHTDNVLSTKPFFIPAGFTRNPKNVDNAAGGSGQGGPSTDFLGTRPCLLRLPYL